MSIPNFNWKITVGVPVLAFLCEENPFLLYFSMNYRDFSVKSKLIISLFQTVKLSLSISLFQKIGFS